MQEQSLPLEYTIDVFNNHLLTNFIWLASVDNFDFDQVSKTLNYLETNIHVYFKKSQRINFKTVNTSAESLSDKKQT
jgi:hypothetical protein